MPKWKFLFSLIMLLSILCHMKPIFCHPSHDLAGSGWWACCCVPIHTRRQQYKEEITATITVNTVIDLTWCRHLDGWDIYYTHIFISIYHGIELSYEYKMPFPSSRNYGLRSCWYQQWYVCTDSCFEINSQNEVCFNQNAVSQAFQVTGVFNHLDNKEPVPISFLFLFLCCCPCDIQYMQKWNTHTNCISSDYYTR